MEIKSMIEVLQAAERGELLQVRYHSENSGQWHDISKCLVWNFAQRDYRIAPKKEISLVERLRELGLSACNEAADRIEELEKYEALRITKFTTDELIDELKRRITG